MAKDNDNPIEIVRRFCAAWSKVSPDEIAEYFTDDAVYHNIPMEPITGRDTIKTFIAGFAGSAEQIDFRVRNIVADGPVVLTERVDVFVMPTGKVELPVMGTFEVEDGKIAAWRDYFDLKQFMDQM
ncbi:MAG TPA: limonene-1,2-epoxide hydrolase family protein, partial [Acidimicrobiia bacterium]|nr:limonene-1,2-epoxide hydrolase family protein [Acidimicrobiia bacterium]